jgi:hypothetical protein
MGKILAEMRKWPAELRYADSKRGFAPLKTEVKNTPEDNRVDPRTQSA